MLTVLVIILAVVPPKGHSAHLVRCDAERYPIGSGYPLKNASYMDPSNTVVRVSKVMRDDSGRKPYVLGFYYKLQNGQTFYEASPNNQSWVRDDQRDFLTKTGIAKSEGAENINRMLSSTVPFSMPAVLTASTLSMAHATVVPCTSMDGKQ